MALAETGLLNSIAYPPLEAKAEAIHYASLSRRRESEPRTLRTGEEGWFGSRKHYICDVMNTPTSGLGNKRTAAFSFENNFSYFPNKFAKAII